MAMVPPAAVALDGGDPRASLAGEGIAEYSRPALKNLHDPSVTIEEYFYYAKLTRAEEKNIPRIHHPVRKLLGFGKTQGVLTESGRRTSVNMPSTEPGLSEKTVTGDKASPSGSTDLAIISDAEWVQASRAARTATWGAIFYLITTDVLGPYSVPWAMLQMGYGPGITLYTVFGALAGYTGWQMWRMFLKLDSNKYPMKTYGDIAFRVYGTVARHLINVLQSIQLVFNVGVIVIGNGQGLYEINSNICFIVCCVIWTVLGMVIGQIRTLQKFGWIANLAIWLNIVVMIITIGVVSHSAPNYDAAATANGADVGTPGNRPPVVTTAGPPAGVEFTGQVVGLMQAVYSYGGAMLYCEFMSEMRKPMDFWKAILIADTFIYIVYLFFGVYVYSFQGQYTINPANQGMSPYGVLTAGNILGFISALIAAALYGNIGIKVLYQNILKELFGLPDLTTKKGKLIWIGCVPIYWTIAWILAAAIPNFSALSGLVAALCILQFTYTFPPLFMLGLKIKEDAIRPELGEGFDPATGQTVRHDSGMKRWVRGFFAGRWYIKLWNLVFFLGAFATCILGTYSSVESLIAAFAASRTTAFSCKGPI
ncbi:hypothetical protein MBLNU459_g7138t1 [Dothideomycetes sp. NU459]